MTQEEKNLVHKHLVYVSNRLATCGVTSPTSPTVIQREEARELQERLSEARAIISMADTSPSMSEAAD